MSQDPPANAEQMDAAERRTTLSLQAAPPLSGQRLYWPAEWETHAATWISWPHNAETWPGHLELIPPVFERLIRVLAEVEKVHVLGGPPNSHIQAQSALADVQNITLHRITTSDSWIRDYGPTFVTDEAGTELFGVSWRFNAWGGKYGGYEADAAAASRICNALGCSRLDSPLTCEGGALETDGEGTLLITPQSLAVGSRNPGWNRDRIELHLAKMLGCTKVIWVEHGKLAGDDTDSHIDQLARFVRPGVVLAAVAGSRDDENAKALEMQFEMLRESTDARANTLDCIALPTPPPRFIHNQRVPESYCNFYLANGIVIVPQFGHPASDDRALGILAEHFANRELVPIDSSNLVWGLGSFHCSTQQQPAVKMRPARDP